MTDRIHITLGNQLFPIEHLPPPQSTVVFMAEDMSLCTYVRHHKQKLTLFLAAMRNYADSLRASGYSVHYHALDGGERSYEQKLSALLESLDMRVVTHFEIEDKFMEERIAQWARERRVTVEILQTPMFLCSRARFSTYLESVPAPRMVDFYRSERQRLNLLVDANGQPLGGRWSFDAENRKRLPASIDLPPCPEVTPGPKDGEVAALVETRFAEHVGSACCWLPTTRAAALELLEDFCERRLEHFGDYEDAISRRSHVLFHSALSSSLNLGLITPAEVVARVTASATQAAVPLNNIEGFIRQLIGWREFVRGIYRHFDEVQASRNFWRHERRLAPTWYSGETGIPPLDDAIHRAVELGWDHHIVRLMIVGNMMTLCGIEPAAAHRWFMEMYVDSSDWVMGPNVYGMALFSDGGIFATKPYICGSNYWLKMSDYERGAWCDVVDGLYWRFVSRHRDFLAANPRLSMMPRTLDRLDVDRKARLFAAAESFLERHTIAA